MNIWQLWSQHLQSVSHDIPPISYRLVGDQTNKLCLTEICMATQRKHTLLWDNFTSAKHHINWTSNNGSITYQLHISQPRLAAYILEALVILWHKSLKFEHTNNVHWHLNTRTMYTDATAAATRWQSDSKITHVFKNENQGTLWTW